VKTALCDRLGIELPIIQAPMGGAVGPTIAAAVSNAGGLGMLAPWRANIDTLRRLIRETRALTSRPFGVNLVLEIPQEDRLAACLEERVPIISFFWGDPSSLVPRAKDSGSIVMHTVGSAADAKRAVGCGVDIVVAQGWEAGGHVRGTVATMPLIPAVVDAVSPMPVVAAGGLAAALALSAAGGWIGTRFLGSHEATIHPDIASDSCRRTRTTRFTRRTYLTSAGQTHPIASLEIKPSRSGRRQGDPKRQAAARGRGDRYVTSEWSDCSLSVLHAR
jgi:NAD(P)H-dependent flavin oxidoreductase YrpB (nitropropane dioxygenase family)